MDFLACIVGIHMILGLPSMEFLARVLAWVLARAGILIRASRAILAIRAMRAIIAWISIGPEFPSRRLGRQVLTRPGGSELHRPLGYGWP